MTEIDFGSIRGLLSDLDGVWFVGDEPIPGAGETLAALRRRKLPLRLVTNTTTRTREEIAARLGKMGLEFAAGEIITSTQAAVLYLREQGRPSCHLLVSDGVRDAFAEFPESEPADYVVLGDIGNRWSYDILNDAFNRIIGGAQLLAMHKGRYWQVSEGLRLDIGAFVAGLEYATGRRAIVAGKPEPLVFRSALSDMGVAPEDAVMVGDDAVSDVGGAQAAGVRGVLVRTGKFREELVEASGVAPDLVIDSVADLRGLLGG
jgi:HAD superfamily hydrolase (TIGR01458 family)